MKKLVLFLGCSLLSLEAKEVFRSEMISHYLQQDNPYVYTLLHQEDIAKERVVYTQGVFDTTLSAKYDNKEYPASTGEYTNFSLHKKIENGMEFTTSYRKAEGTQEYNNIKTSTDGEMLFGVKLPVFSLINGTNNNKTALELAVLDTLKYKQISNNNLRLFYLEVFNSYYTLLYNKLANELDRKRLEKMMQRKEFIQKKINSGTLAEIAVYEIEQQILQSRQNYLSSTTAYDNGLRSFLKYLNISQEAFLAQYTLLDRIDTTIETMALEDAIEIAKQNRPDLKMLSFEQQKAQLQKKNSDLLKYPNFDVSLYGVHDFKYDNGFKIALDFSLPLERSRYEAKRAEYQKVTTNIRKLEEKKLLEIRSTIANTLNSLHLLAQNTANAQEELFLAQKLEEAEYKKYLAGSSSLFFVNQRELYTLSLEKKVLHNKLTCLLLKEQLQNQMGTKRF